MANTVTTFYGYKGGSGRSFTLAHVAWILAHGYGRRVLVVDADLEAPGVGDFFTTVAPRFDTVWRRSAGLLDIINDFGDTPNSADLANRLSDVGFFRSASHSTVDAMRIYLHRISGDSQLGQGCIDFLGPGKVLGGEYATDIIRQDWNEFYAYRGQRFFRSFARILRQHYDHVLFDMRAGLTNSTARAAVAIADDLVMFATPSHQAITGLEELQRWLLRERRRLIEAQGFHLSPLRRAAVLTRLEQSSADARGLFEVSFCDPGEPSGADSIEGDKIKRFVIPHVAGIQHEHLLEQEAHKNNLECEHLVLSLGELAAWIARAPPNAAATIQAFMRLPSRTSRPSDDQKDSVLTEKARALLDQGRKFGSWTPDAASTHDPQRPALAGGDFADSPHSNMAQLIARRAELRDSYRELPLISAALFDRLLDRDPEADKLKKLFGIVAAVQDFVLSTPAQQQSSPDHSEYFPATVSSPADFENLSQRAGLFTATDEIVGQLHKMPTTTSSFLERASAAHDLLGRATFLDYQDAFDLARAELSQLAEKSFSLEPKARWVLGYYLVGAADTLRTFGDWMGDAEQLLLQGWRAGGLFSSGKPPPINETSGLITYAFLLGATGRVSAARATLLGVYDAISAADDDGRPESGLFGTIRRSYAWWDAALQLQGPDGRRADGSDLGVTSLIVSIERNLLNSAEIVALNRWAMAALRCRGELNKAREASERIISDAQIYDWRGEPPRLSKLYALLSKAQIDLLLHDQNSLRATLDSAEEWANGDSLLFKPVVTAHRGMIALTRGLLDDAAVPAALAAVEYMLMERPSSGKHAINTADLRHRLPMLVRAALTAVRKRDPRAGALIDRCGHLIDPDELMLDNIWGDECRYLLERARERYGKSSSAAAALDRACRRIAGDDTATRRTADDGLSDLADIWLTGHL